MIDFVSTATYKLLLHTVRHPDGISRFPTGFFLLSQPKASALASGSSLVLADFFL
jgi:hypothetical protein